MVPEFSEEDDFSESPLRVGAIPESIVDAFHSHHSAGSVEDFWITHNADDALHKLSTSVRLPFTDGLVNYSVGTFSEPLPEVILGRDRGVHGADADVLFSFFFVQSI